MSPARADDSHDQRYTHEHNKEAAPTEPDTRVMLYGKPYAKGAGMIQDTMIAANAAEVDEAITSGSWRAHPKAWDPGYKAPAKSAGFSRVGAMIAACCVAVLGLTVGLVGQTAQTSTTLSAALAAPAQGAPAQVVSLTSGTNVVVGWDLYVDTELMRVTAIDPNVSTNFTVTRGWQRTKAAAHGNSALVYAGPPVAFSANDMYGTCTSTANLYLPHINTDTGNIFNCVATSTLAGSPATNWSQWFVNGYPNFKAGSPLTGWTYTTAGAITVQPGVQYIGSAGALAMTLANPTTAQNGMIMTLLASTAQAHTITNTSGFMGGTTARDVCTLGGAIGDGLTIYADAGLWWVLVNRNCTLG